MVFSSPPDASFQIKTEGEQIVLTFEQGMPISGQGTIHWTIPGPAQGCNSPTDSSYCGMLVLLSTTPFNAAHIPADGKIYIADPTADFNLHAGDRIEEALVVGAVYEQEKKGQGKPLTDTIVISNLQTNTPYYVIGYAVDCQYRYHSDGQRSYSNEYGNIDGQSYPSSQIIRMGETGIIPTDGTNLTPGFLYEFDISYNNQFPDPDSEQIINFKFDGIDVGTYQQLVDQINQVFALANNPPQSPLAPNSGSLYWDSINTTLYQFNGTTHDPLTTTIIEPTDPSTVVAGTYWHDTTNETLNIRNGSPLAWGNVPIIEYNTVDPTALTHQDHWYDGSQGYVWDGTTWCELTTIIDSIDPAACPVLETGTYWYDESTETLKVRNLTTLVWDTVSAIMWDTDPNAFTVGEYWFDLNTTKLFIRDAGSPAWVEQVVTIQDDEPINPAIGFLWYSTTTEELYQYSAGSPVWVQLPVLTWPGDPTDIASCNLWWETPSDILRTWDIVNNEWDVVTSFVSSIIDPAVAPIIVVNTIWYDTVNLILKKYDGVVWVDIAYINHATDPTQPNSGDAWFDVANTKWFIWNTPTTGTWNEIDPIDHQLDPTSIANGVYWYNTTNDAVFVRSGISWVSATFTTLPLTPSTGTVWYDTTENILKTWNGSMWVADTPIATAEVDSDGNMLLKTAEVGSTVNMMVVVPGGIGPVGSGYADFQFHSFVHYGTNEGITLPLTDVTSQTFLFNNLQPKSRILTQTYGIDGTYGVPSYDVIGVGDDGTPDERRELKDSIRQQLGYPVVDVELTPYQLDTAVQAALESFRKRSSMAYKRGFYFLDVRGGLQRYNLSNRLEGFHKIVSVTAAYRFTSAFLSTAHGAGVYGQIVLQHLYNMGTYDLTSFHLIAQYIEQLEHLFATRLTFHWDETSRNLDLFHSFVYPERILLDCAVERTEQDLLKDRFAKSWIERYALAESMSMLAQIRGKYASLPGAGGGVSLNASDLMQLSAEYRAECMEQIDEMITDSPEVFGMETTMVIG